MMTVWTESETNVHHSHLFSMKQLPAVNSPSPRFYQ